MNILHVCFKLSCVRACNTWVTKIGSTLTRIAWQPDVSEHKAYCMPVKMCSQIWGRHRGVFVHVAANLVWLVGSPVDIWVAFTPLALDEVGILKSFSRPLISPCSPCPGWPGMAIPLLFVCYICGFVAIRVFLCVQVNLHMQLTPHDHCLIRAKAVTHTITNVFKLLKVTYVFSVPF